ncbi:MAG: hypothetical protein A3D56_00010 [Candidatus Taylorbacteria bacterium RIFCSPHIGHO2_02_FULL_45_35]|uniref:Uncharacterized protein n=1 Tax=Candidatus Taylorbacteria bacterium RIFCSPHIGHO2_02_FULL_45_35 TaxID=1802311 RepID=A0A1G2MXX3_9BACT|nr:MAG: hypothetical protein A3D56_00010 [Candidatus Taylorbacteria bacterium RIFCSPHIGHO2_02_FULL_45_35]
MDQENQQVQDNGGGKSSKKGLYIIVVVIAGILIIGWMAKGSMRAVTGVDVDTKIDGSATYTTNDGTVTVGGNSLPDEWPSDAPKYPGASIQYSGSSNPQTGEAGIALSFLTSDSLQKVVDFYKEELPSNGWVVEQTMNSGGSTVMAAKKGDRTFGLYIADSGDGKVSVTVSISTPTGN